MFTVIYFGRYLTTGRGCSKISQSKCPWQPLSGTAVIAVFTAVTVPTDTNVVQGWPPWKPILCKRYVVRVLWLDSCGTKV